MNQLISDKQSSESHVELPVFDKSLHGGQGGRSTQTVKIEPPIDVFILEGWSVGFEPLSDTVLEDLYAQALEGNRNVRQGTSTSTKYMASHDLQSLKQVNQFLRDFSTQIWPLFSSIITIRPTNYEYVFEWRLQQELALRQRSEGRGMSDEGVRLFVARYMPGYELWADQIKRSPRWENRGLEMVYGSGRELLELHTF
jgi:pantothenate kinase-related protein Tda10